MKPRRVRLVEKIVTIFYLHTVSLTILGLPALVWENPVNLGAVPGDERGWES